MPSFAILAGISRNWWALAIRGFIAVLFGLCAFLWPGLTLAALLFLWAAFAVADGVMAVIAGGRGRWWALVFFGVLAIFAGVFTLLRPGITALALLFVIAGWAIARGIFDIVAAIRLRKELSNEWLLALSGLLSVAVGILLAMFPGAGVLSLLWLIGAYAFVVGVLLLMLAFRLRSLGRRTDARRAA